MSSSDGEWKMKTRWPTGDIRVRKWLHLIYYYENMQASEVEQPMSVDVQALRQPSMKKHNTVF